MGDDSTNNVSRKPADISRRSFLAGTGTGAVAGLGAFGAGSVAAEPAATPAPVSPLAPPKKPVAVSSGNGLRTTARAVELMSKGADTLEAVLSGVNIVEADPTDMSVGYGGLPNEEGVVELDSCCMHGPSYNAGSVASIRDIKLPSRVAELVLKRTDHVMLVGEGARRFAIAHGFKAENLLTEAARKRWLRWKESLSDQDDWLTPDEAKTGHAARPTGTITCLGVNTASETSGVTTTSGLAFKIPGRIGDSPIIGAGLYVDHEIGAAGATGRGEAVIISSGSRIVVENMRHGMTPKEAVLDVLRRIVKQTVDPRLRKENGRPSFEVVLYALRKDGEHAAGSIYPGRKYAVNDGGKSRLLNCVHLFDK